MNDGNLVVHVNMQEPIIHEVTVYSQSTFAGDNVLTSELLPVNVVSYNHHLSWNAILYVKIFKKLENDLHAHLVGMDDRLWIQLPLLTYHNPKMFPPIDRDGAMYCGVGGKAPNKVSRQRLDQWKKW